MIDYRRKILNTPRLCRGDFLLNFDYFRKKVLRGLGKVKDGLADFGGKIAETFGKGKDALVDFGSKAFDTLKNVGSKLAEVTKELLKNAAAALKSAVAWAKHKAALIADKIATVAATVAKKAAAVASKIWAGVQWLLNAAMAANPIIIIILAVIALIAVIVLLIKNWDKVKEALIKGAAAVGDFFKKAWEGIKQAVSAVFSVIKTIIITYVNIYKAVFAALIKFFVWLWEGIAAVAKAAWDGIKNIVSGVVDGIKNVWNGITGFFSGLWEAIKQGPAEAIEYIKNAFFGLFNAIQEKLFGFIDKIREGWEKVKGFFGGIGEGVVNFFTGGDGGGQLQPAYAGASQAAMAGVVGQIPSYAYTAMGGASTVNAQTSINVNVPQGTSREQSEAIARQIDAQFEAKLAGSINSSRANIPSPEVRRR